MISGGRRKALSFVLIVLAFWLVGSARRVVDTRTFTRIYASLATSVVVDQRNRSQGVSATVARTGLTREFVNFFEGQLPAMATAIVSIVGATVLLLGIQPATGLVALLVLISCFAWLPKFLSLNQRLHERLNNRMEHEVTVAEQGSARTLERHYRVMSELRIWLSNREAATFLFNGLVAAGLFGIAIAQMADAGHVQPGHIYAVMTYLWTFVTSLDEAPILADQIARLKDIGQRLSPGADTALQTY